MDWQPDWGLRARMALTMFLLFAVYLIFIVALVETFSGSLFLVALLLGSFSLVQFFYSDRLTLWSMGAKTVEPADYPTLHAAIDRLSQQADLPKPKVAVVESKIPNAFATGRSPNSAAVAVTTGLLRELNQDELDGVLAHELAHVKNHDMAIMTIASFLATVAFLIVRFGSRMMLFSGGNRAGGKGAAGILVAILISLVVWLISYILIRALSRYREYAADRGAAAITGNPSALAAALETISGSVEQIPDSDLREEAEMNAFFIIPLRSGFIGKIFSTHPPTEKRIEQLRKLEREMEQSI